MKKRNQIGIEEKMASENRNIFTSAHLTIEKDFIKEEGLEQILENYKSSLLALFKPIKTFQNDYFSRENKSNKIKILKKSLNTLKESLSKMNREKTRQYNALKVAKEDSIMRKQEILFPENDNDNINYEYDLCSSYIKKKIELNYLNFQLENEIQKTDILIGIKNKTYLYLKHITFYLNLNREIFCKINQEDTETVSEILKNIRTLVKNEFISVVKEKMETDLEIDSVTSKIKTMNDNIIKYKKGDNKYVNEDEIIYEDTKEDNKTLFINNQNKRNTCANINKIGFNKNLLKRPSNNLAKKHLSIDEALEDNFYRNKILELFLKNNDFMNNNINQINNFLNINVNINLGNNKYNCSSSSSENEEGCKNNQNVNISSDISSNKSEEEIKENND